MDEPGASRSARVRFRQQSPNETLDCYALGMVIYEIISGHLPFHEQTDFMLVPKVLKGKRPRRGAEFTGILWEMLELCWMARLSDRPNIEDVLQCLVGASQVSRSPSPSVDETTTSEEDTDDCNSANESSGKISNFIPSAGLHGPYPLREHRNTSIH